MSPEAEASPGLYVHVPFCSAICPYCDFAVTLGNEDRVGRYLEALEREIRLASEPRPHDTLYFGGGTPSRLFPSSLSRVIDALRGAGWLARDARIFVEVNPEDASSSWLNSVAALGVDTLSLGVQALDEAGLRFLGRRHSVSDARSCIDAARNAGFATVSADLIYGLPGQRVSSWRRQLETVAELPVDHLSCYQLTVHAGTMFHRRGIDAPDDEEQAELFLTTHRVLGELGFEGYEVSNFARSEAHRSKHNEKYWNHLPYRGLGPSAHSFDGRERYWNERSFFDWEKRLGREESPVAGRERLSDQALALETLMLGLRTRQGVDTASYGSRYGIDLVERAVRAVEEGLLRYEQGWLRPTLRGMAVADGLAVTLHG